jgi:hypothetical protein
MQGSRVRQRSVYSVHFPLSDSLFASIHTLKFGISRTLVLRRQVVGTAAWLQTTASVHTMSVSLHVEHVLQPSHGLRNPPAKTNYQRDGPLVRWGAPILASDDSTFISTFVPAYTL